jgi:hypothetical protein
VERLGNAVLYQALVIPHQVLAQWRTGQQGQFLCCVLVMRQRVGSGPAPGRSSRKRDGQELEALRLKPPTSRYVPGPVGAGVQKEQRGQGRVPGQVTLSFTS